MVCAELLTSHMCTCNPGTQASTYLGFWVTLAGSHPHTVLHHRLLFLQEPTPPRGQLLHRTHEAMEGSHVLGSHGEVRLPIPREQLKAVSSWCCCPPTSQMFGRGEKWFCARGVQLWERQHRLGRNHPMAESPLPLGPRLLGNIFGEEKSPPQENAVHSSMPSAQGGRKGLSWAIPAACLCPSRPAGSLCESTGTLHAAPQPGLRLAFPCRLQRGV